MRALVSSSGDRIGLRRLDQRADVPAIVPGSISSFAVTLDRRPRRRRSGRLCRRRSDRVRRRELLHRGRLASRRSDLLRTYGACTDAGAATSKMSCGSVEPVKLRSRERPPLTRAVEHVLFEAGEHSCGERRLGQHDALAA